MMRPAFSQWRQNPHRAWSPAWNNSKLQPPRHLCETRFSHSCMSTWGSVGSHRRKLEATQVVGIYGNRQFADMSETPLYGLKSKKTHAQKKKSGNSLPGGIPPQEEPSWAWKTPGLPGDQVVVTANRVILSNAANSMTLIQKNLKIAVMRSQTMGVVWHQWVQWFLGGGISGRLTRATVSHTVTQ